MVESGLAHVAKDGMVRVPWIQQLPWRLYHLLAL